MSGFDDIRAPQMDLIDDCVHCGFCLPTCPTYRLWGEEMDSPRGRIVLMKQGHAELSAPLIDHIDNCLGCMACVTACPSGVQYDKLIEDTRAQIERNVERPRSERAFRRLVFELFPHPGRLRALAPGLALAQRLGLPALAAAPAPAAPGPAPGRDGRALPRRLGRGCPAAPARALRGPRRASRHGGAAPGMRAARVLLGRERRHRAGAGRGGPRGARAPRCPAAAARSSCTPGEDTGARTLAKATIEALEDYETVVVNAAGCGSAMKDYGHVLRDEPAWADRAQRFSERVRDATEVLADLEPRAERRPVSLRLAYHDACHLAHAQGVRAQPRELLRAIPGVELLEPDDWQICCGSAGVYNLVKPEPAAELGEMKARNLLATGAEAVVAGNPGCALQITASAARLGRSLPVLHPLEVLARSIAPAE